MPAEQRVNSLAISQGLYLDPKPSPRIERLTDAETQQYWRLNNEVAKQSLSPILSF